MDPYKSLSTDEQKLVDELLFGPKVAVEEQEKAPVVTRQASSSSSTTATKERSGKSVISHSNGSSSGSLDAGGTSINDNDEGDDENTRRSAGDADAASRTSTNESVSSSYAGGLISKLKRASWASVMDHEESKPHVTDAKKDAIDLLNSCNCGRYKKNI